jgi:tripartite-type tricarboxylate transporter receptor subunit TctC
MTIARLAAIWLALLGIAAADRGATAQPDSSQSYTSKPVKLVVPYPPGGPNDIIARILAQKLTEGLGGTFFVENTSVPAAPSPPGRWRMRRRTAPPSWLPTRT